MSIIADMKPMILQIKEEIEMPSGAKKEKWNDVKTIDVAIYLIDDMKNTQSVRYNESTNTGITFFKNIDKNNNRLKDGSVIYTITKVNNKGRFTTLLLKGIDIDV
ncbi:hypothetical protein PMY12_18555 [Clostridium tertium]|uniref:hypothetical protein n=1 Tax=Clostridium tertium TaxID=1559 RepID=UPI00232CB521|nr:hypothetical protein [Clostridium tertium]MDB1935269.1 hypothetical protein [Clostridium tertium]MDB1939011.1 hypothetical protein [Clostridium tertium]